MFGVSVFKKQDISNGIVRAFQKLIKSQRTDSIQYTNYDLATLEIVIEAITKFYWKISENLWRGSLNFETRKETSLCPKANSKCFSDKYKPQNSKSQGIGPKSKKISQEWETEEEPPKGK